MMARLLLQIWTKFQKENEILKKLKIQGSIDSNTTGNGKSHFKSGVALLQSFTERFTWSGGLDIPQRQSQSIKKAGYVAWKSCPQWLHVKLNSFI